MKFNSKQLENMARVFGSLCVAAGVGAAIGIARPETVTQSEHASLIVAALGMFCAMLFVLMEGKK
jgi:hypothetical protein